MLSARRLAVPITAMLAVGLVGCGGEPSATRPAGPEPARAGASPLTPAASPQPASAPPLAVAAPSSVRLSNGDFAAADAAAATSLAGRFVDATRRNPALFRYDPKTAADFAAALPLFDAPTRKTVTSNVAGYVRSSLNGGTDTAKATADAGQQTFATFAVLSPRGKDVPKGKESRALGGNPDPAGSFGPASLTCTEMYDDATRPGELFLTCKADTVYLLVDDGKPTQTRLMTDLILGLVREADEIRVSGFSTNVTDFKTTPRP